jgi:hypothetical protein
MNKAVYTLAAVALLTASSCNKNQNNNEEPNQTPSKPIPREHIIGAYRITKVEGSGSGMRSDITETWFTNYVGECAKDDITEFKPDNNFAVTGGTTACSSSTDFTGTWDVFDATHMKIDFDTVLVEAASPVMLRIVSPFYSNAQNKVIFTYTRQ